MVLNPKSSWDSKQLRYSGNVELLPEQSMIDLVLKNGFLTAKELLSNELVQHRLA